MRRADGSIESVHYNVDGPKGSAKSDDLMHEIESDEISYEDFIEMIRHRHLLRNPVDFWNGPTTITMHEYHLSESPDRPCPENIRKS